jgi:asparagine synthase (glutamine-hydrolysing)
MCGIAGVIGQEFNRDRLETLIYRMQAAIRHRGPDGQGTYISADQDVALAHTRLSILDLSPAGHQPMSIANDRYWITFNGEIYNFQALRSQLNAQGESFQSNTDTEVILKLYQRFGPDCVHHLRGMFAFAIWDNVEKSCFIARDPLGIKPLYYWLNGSTLVFASELRSVLASGLPTVTLSPAGLYGYLIGGSVPEPYTLIQDIQCLEAGHWLRWQAGSVKSNQYWQANFTYQPMTEGEAREQVRAALIDSVQHHFISDVPVGMFLSGGIDSTAVVALARQTQRGQLKTYSITFEEAVWNEGDIARKTAQVFETDHTEYKVTATLGRDLFSHFLSAIDQPTVDGFNTYCVSQLAQENGAKVVLSGLGGDELFGGYPSFQKVPQMVRWGKKTDFLRPLSLPIGYGLEHWTNSPKWRRIGDYLQQVPTSFAAYRSMRGIFSHWEAQSILKHYLPKDELVEREWFKFSQPLPTLEDEVSLLELNYYMRNQLLRDSDVMSMARGLELRVPLVDKVLLETLSTIPSNLRIAHGKKLLTQAVPELPDFVLNRPKQGFSFPFERWLGQEWQGCLPGIRKFEQIPLHSWYRQWSLSILEYWWKQNTNESRKMMSCNSYSNPT